MARIVKQWLKGKTITKIAEFFQVTMLLQRTRLRYSEKDSLNMAFQMRYLPITGLSSFLQEIGILKVINLRSLDRDEPINVFLYNKLPCERIMWFVRRWWDEKV